MSSKGVPGKGVGRGGWVLERVGMQIGLGRRAQSGWDLYQTLKQRVRSLLSGRV